MTQKKIIFFVGLAIVALVAARLFVVLSRKAPAESPPYEVALPQPETLNAPPAQAPLPSVVPPVEVVKGGSQVLASSGSAAGPSRITGPQAPYRPSIEEVQRALKRAGFDPGSADGKLGRRTTQAILDFQRANGLQADGKAGPRTWAKLKSYWMGKETSQ